MCTTCSWCRRLILDEHTYRCRRCSYGRRCSYDLCVGCGIVGAALSCDSRGGSAHQAPLAMLMRTENAPTNLQKIVFFTEQNDTVHVGRQDSNHVVMDDPKISRVHATLVWRVCEQKGVGDGEVPRRVFVRDSSTFGTFINGKAVARGWAMLQEGDILGLRYPHGSPSAR